MATHDIKRHDAEREFVDTYIDAAADLLTKSQALLEAFNHAVHNYHRR